MSNTLSAVWWLQKVSNQGDASCDKGYEL